MKIPSKLPITAEQSRAVRFQLGLTQANVIEQSELAGHKLKNFETGRFVPDMAFLQRLREFYEGRGIDFSEIEATPASTQTSTVASPSPRLDASLKVEYFFPLSNNIPDEVIGNAMDIMEENDARLAVLLKAKAEREQGFFGDGELTEETEAALQETFALLAGNYVIFRMLRGWRAFNQPPADENSKTVRDMLLETFKQPLIDAGLIEADAQPAEVVEEVEEVQP
ncbi:MAG: hypothetical protein A3H31_02720 [Gallionellales bacterium RIFCSPLOWO2_02_FULL_57_47]|nr:MAG: hypothetical protein A3H31_02720 [Gallionellales bacterium RIFCSPLOWO2_02_FULL_57_47]OGT17302.1 MAG: hypothetical protein A3J49_02245 [Gallionellales bacterium RIFCSPHIGHO2_02_FULL_57_16]